MVARPHAILVSNKFDDALALQEIIPEVQTAVAKFSRDLTQLARQNNLDPVVGRSDEIRR